MPAKFDPTGVDFESILATEHDLIEERHWQPDKAPEILERYRKNIVPVQLVASDNIIMQTVVLVVGQPIRLVGRQYDGIGSRVRITNYSATNNDILVLTGSNALGAIKTRGGTDFATYTDQGITLPGLVGSVPGPWLELVTRDEIWVAAGIGSPACGFIVETYDNAGS